MKKAGKEKPAEMASTIGAGVIGFGLGALLANYLGQYASWIILTGLIMHSVGMYKLRFEYRTTREKALYWLCWLILSVILVYAAVVVL